MHASRPARPHPSRRLRRALIWGGVLILLCSGAALAFGSKRIISEDAAFVGPAAAGCVPSDLNRSAVLDRTSVAVSPLPNSFDASPDTQVSLLGAPPSEISEMRIRGSASGAHAGSLRPYSQGDGASFVPSKPFAPGERVTVSGRVGSVRFRYRFTISKPDTLAHPPPGPQAAGSYSEVQHFKTRPDLQPPAITATVHSAQPTPGYIFLAPYAGAGQDGPMIFDDSGNLVWFHPLPVGTEATNFQVEQYEGQPVLTWWQGYIPPQGFGEGEEVIMSDAYQVIKRVHAGNGYKVDLHEFHITPNDTAILTVFNPIHCNLATIGGPQDGAVTDSIFQEIDLKTGLVRKEWHSLDHVGLSESYSTPVGSNTEWPFDYFHLNSIDPLDDGRTLISARNVWALYELNTSTGQIVSKVGGKSSSVKSEHGTATAYQHDATELPGGRISIFDNGAVPKVHPQSRAIIVALNAKTKTETLVATYEHPTPLLAGSQGNTQPLASGDVFVGWGAEPYVSEFNRAGKLIFDAHMPPSDQSYRAYRFEWSGDPEVPPAIAAFSKGPKSPVIVYASWNGATRVSSWRVLAGPSATALSPVITAPRTSFETRLQTPGPEAYLALQALDSAGDVIGTSRTVKR
jgi:hypothetical protein